MLILPVVAIAFFIIFKLIVGRLEAVYTEGVTKELVTKSSLIAASIDVSLLEEINDLDDIANGNFDELRESLMRLIEADADWTDDMCMELYTAKRTPYNYLIISESFSDEFLGSYLFQTEKGLSVNRYGDTNVYVTQTTSEAYGYVDAFTLIYNDEGKLIGILDVYVYADKVAEQVEEVREKVTLIAAIVLLIIMSLLIGVAKYITSTLEKNLAHYRTLLSIEFTLGESRKADAAYLDSCRAKRNHVEYDYVDGASKSEAEELLTFTKALREDVVTRLRKKYPSLGLAVEDPPA